MISIRLCDLTIGYKLRHHRARVVASGINALFPGGQMTCILGRNGVGKSTLLRTIAGQQAPISGEICLKEERGERREEKPNPNPSPREGRNLPLTPPEGRGIANPKQKLPTHSNTVPPSLGEGMGVGFLSSLMSFLDSHLDDTDLKIDDMAAAVSLGRTVFYGKLKSIVGMTPIDFLRHVRLQKAQQLLANSSLNVSEIAYTVGFSDPKYFSKIFRKELGVSPTEYRAQMQKQ